MNKEKALEYIQAKITIVGDCWIWYKTDVRQYGRATFHGRRMLAHRFSWLVHHGEPPSDMEVCHSCDVPLCVNPAHLFIGTHKQNMLDAVNKNRMHRPRGQLSGHCKLSDQIVLDILTSELPSCSMAIKHGVRLEHVSKIRTGSTWGHLRQGLTIPEYRDGRTARAENMKPVARIKNPDGKEFAVCNISKFAREHGMCRETLRLLIKGSLAHHRQWTLA